MNYDTEEYKGYRIIIDYYQDPMNPRTEWDNAATMVCWHRNYDLGDSESWKGIDGKRKSQNLSKNYNEPIDLLYELAGIDRDDLEEDMKYDDLIEEITKKGHLISALYLYDHSGITISMSSFGCRWDSGQVGWIYIKKEKIVEEWGEGEDAYEKAKKCMGGEVQVYDNYLTGEVYGFTIEDPDGEHIDSCWGYYGDDGKEDMLSECKSTIDRHIKNKEKRALLLGIQLKLEYGN
jgi:hypothetical protein